MKITFEIPEDSAPRLQSAYESHDPELLKYLSGPLPILLRELDNGRLEAKLTRRGNPVIQLDNICCCFHLVAKHLRHRYKNRPTLEIQDEYDVQDLLGALMCLHFSDIRSEEWVPSYAGKNARADFLLKEEKIIVEVKIVSANLRERELHDQLPVDIQHYRAHPDCEKLFCFVYDPDGLLKNPKGIENDLYCDESGFQVFVRIAPKGL